MNSDIHDTHHDEPREDEKLPTLNLIFWTAFGVGGVFSLLSLWVGVVLGLAIAAVGFLLRSKIS